jgi:hypothetical protein
VTRRMRAVHGQTEKGVQTIWFYVPHNASDKSETKRRGWWLYPEPLRARHYYIGPPGYIQKNKTTNAVVDIASYNAFPFDHTIMKDAVTGEDVPGTERCVTSRPLNVTELAAARNGEKIDEAKNEPGGGVEEQQREDCRSNRADEGQGNNKEDTDADDLEYNEKPGASRGKKKGNKRKRG